MPLLVLSMEVFVVDLTALPHLPQDLQPPLSETPQRAGVAFAFGSVRLIIRRRPIAELATAVSPQVHDVPQTTVAVPANLRPPNLPAFKTDRRCARQALQALHGEQLAPLTTDFREQPRR
jgi:hypothetical protein